MGYDLHLTRADDWTRSAADPIALDEWLAVAATNPLVVAAALGANVVGDDGEHHRRDGTTFEVEVEAEVDADEAGGPDAPTRRRRWFGGGGR